MLKNVIDYKGNFVI